LPISDSLSGTTTCIELRSLRTAKEELDEALEAVLVLDVPVVDRAAVAPVAAAALDPESPEELLELDAFVVPLPETTSPTCPESETIVPLSGA
jgi:hypothetical protein